MARGSGSSPAAPQFVLAAAIVSGCALIAGGLYFGLRDRTAAPGGDPAAPALSGAPPADADAAVSGPDLQARVEAEVRQALEALRPVMVETCWQPAAASEPEPARARYRFHITVDADGREIARGVSEFRDAFRPAAGRCLRELQGAEVKIAPPGAVFAVEIELTLPD